MTKIAGMVCSYRAGIKLGRTVVLKISTGTFTPFLLTMLLLWPGTALR
jgi:hypothetical protein